MRLTNRKRGCAVLVAGLCMLVLPHHPAKSSGWAAPKSLNQVGVPVEAIRAVVPADNSQTLEKIALGVRLFFDGRLSVDGTVACGTCHDPARAFTDGRSEEHTSELQSRGHLVCRLLLEKKKR